MCADIRVRNGHVLFLFAGTPPELALACIDDSVGATHAPGSGLKFHFVRTRNLSALVFNVKLKPL